MPSKAETKPVGDDVPRVEGTVAVGEDLEFQRRWWRFEKIVWSLFILILLADLSGLLGRGPLANAERTGPDGSFKLKYERTLRENTASIMTLLPSASAVRHGELQVFVSASVVKQLGASRIIPEPKTSTLGNGGVLYTFPATNPPITVQIEVKPSFVGMHRFTVGIPGSGQVTAKSFVLP